MAYINILELLVHFGAYGPVGLPSALPQMTVRSEDGHVVSLARLTQMHFQVSTEPHSQRQLSENPFPAENSSAQRQTAHL